MTQHPFADILSDTIIDPHSATYKSSWADISDVEEYTGAKYSFHTMKPGSTTDGYTMSINANGYMVTTACPSNSKVKSISFSFLTTGKNLTIYGSNSAYNAGTAPSEASVGSVSGTGDAVSFDFSTLDTNYKYVAFKGTASSTLIKTITVTYEELPPSVRASSTSLELAAGETSEVEITVSDFVSVPVLECSVQSGNSSIASATVGPVDGSNKATATITASNTTGVAVVRVRDSANSSLYYVDIQITVVESVKAIVESRVTTNSSLTYHYSIQNSTKDILTKSFINESGDNYADWYGKEGASGTVYAGNSHLGNTNNAIQLRSDNSNSGIITTATNSSGYVATKITLKWESHTANGRTIDVYGKNTAYSNVANLYATHEVNDIQVADPSIRGELLGSSIYNNEGSSTTYIEINGSYSFIGIRSNSGALYLESIEIQWGTPSYTYSKVGMRFGGLISQELWNRLDTASHITGYGVLLSTSAYLNGVQLKDKYNAVDGTNVKKFQTNLPDTSVFVNRQDPNHPDEASDDQKGNLVGDYYIWNLCKEISVENLTLEYTAVAFIVTQNDGVVFLIETSKSVKELAGDMIDDDSNGIDRHFADGSLKNLADLPVQP